MCFLTLTTGLGHDWLKPLHDFACDNPGVLVLSTSQWPCSTQQTMYTDSRSTKQFGAPRAQSHVTVLSLPLARLLLMNTLHSRSQITMETETPS
jgi:hypothetical protein